MRIQLCGISFCRASGAVHCAARKCAVRKAEAHHWTEHVVLQMARMRMESEGRRLRLTAD